MTPPEEAAHRLRTLSTEHRKLRRQLLDLTRRLSQSEERADHLTYSSEAFAAALEDAVRWLDALHGSGGRLPLPTRPARRTVTDADTLRQQAVAGARSVAVAPTDEGSLLIEVDGVTTKVPPLLADLLTLLLEAHAPQGASFTSYPDLAKALGLRRGKAYDRDAMIRLVHELRRVFRQAGINPYFVETRRKSGVRFRLQSAGTFTDRRASRR